jgi:hypothetical protein
MTVAIGSVQSETFYVGIAGQTFTRVSSRVNDAAVTFAPTFTDLTGGFYRYSYTPIAVGIHEWAGNGSTSGPLTINFDVLTAAQFDPAADLGPDLAALLARIGALSVAQVPLTNVNGGAVWTRRVP